MAQIEDTNKRYYFFKYPFDFFDRPEVAIISAMENGDAVIMLFFWMITKSANCSGYLRISDRATYSAATLAVASHRPVEVCTLALTILQQFGFIDILDDGTIYIRDIDNFVGSEAVRTADRRRQREAKKARDEGKTSKKRQCRDNVAKCRNNVGQMSTDIEIDIEKEKDIEIDSDKERDAKRVPTLPTLKEIEEYITSKGYIYVNPDTFFKYYQAHDWKGTHGADVSTRWQSFVDLWESRDKAESKRGNLNRLTAPDRDGFRRDQNGVAYMTRDNYDMQRDDAITLLTEGDI